MNIDDYTYKNCGKLLNIYLTSYNFVIINDKLSMNYTNNIIKTLYSINSLRAFVLINSISNIYAQISVIDPEDKNLCTMIGGIDILKFLELE